MAKSESTFLERNGGIFQKKNIFGKSFSWFELINKEKDVRHSSSLKMHLMVIKVKKRSL